MNTHEKASPTVSQTASIDPRRHRQAIHWRVPTVMLGSLLAGIVAAVGHHLFYKHYDTQPVRDISEQKYLSNGGTAFAFLVKMFLAIATGTAYIQLFWLSLRTTSHSLGQVDRLYSVLGNITVFWDLSLWFRNPLLSTLAIVTWMLPLAVIITPGTLTVQTSYQTSQLMTKPPQMSLDPKNYALPALYYYPSTLINGIMDVPDTSGPLSQVMAITVGAAVQQAILPITPPRSNASYQLKFVAPALQCAEPPQSNISAFRQALNIAKNSTWFGFSDTYNIIYNTWAPNDLYHPDLSNPNWNNGSSDSVYIDGTYGRYAGGTTFVYVGQTDAASNFVLLQCTLYNATYDVQFRFSGTNQDIRISNLTYLNAAPVTLEYEDTSHTWENNGITISTPTYTAIMWAFNQLLVGIGLAIPSMNQITPKWIGTLAQITALGRYVDGTDVLELNAVKDTVEQIFHNITLSFLSSDNFLLNSTDRQSVNTTISTFQPRYLYQPTNIYIAYGSSILSSLICVVIGCIALLQNGFSYSNSLTTVIRTTRRKEITDVVTPKNSIGGEPLDERIENVVVQFKTVTRRRHDNNDDDQHEMCGLTTLHSGVEERMMQHGQDFEGISELPRPPHRGLSASPAIRRKPLPQ